MKGLMTSGPDYVIRTLEVIDKFEGLIDNYDDYPIPEGYTEIPWEIVAYDYHHSMRGQPENIHGFRSLGDSTRVHFTEYYRAQGHPILNSRMGRPKKED